MDANGSACIHKDKKVETLLCCALQVKALNIPASDSFDFCGFLAAPPTVQDWNIQGLPADSFSTANGVMVTRGRRWPLLVDPQVRGNHTLGHDGQHMCAVSQLNIACCSSKQTQGNAASLRVL